MRLDKFLKVSRIIKRRSVANEACDAARVSANGRPVKASYQVKVGDILEIGFGQAEDVESLLRAHGLCAVKTEKDFASLTMFLLGGGTGKEYTPLLRIDNIRVVPKK